MRASAATRADLRARTEPEWEGTVVAGRLSRVADSRAGWGWILPWLVMKAVVAIARTGPARADKARQDGVRRGAPPRSQAARIGPAPRPLLPPFCLRPRSAETPVSEPSQGGWSQGCPAPSPFFPSLG